MEIVQRRLQNDFSIFEAETEAIVEALQFCRNFLPLGSIITIVTDAMLVILSATSKKQILCFTHRLQENMMLARNMFDIRLDWVKGHS